MKTGKFLSGPMSEIKKITWPTRKETIKYTITVLAICILVAVILGLFDLLYMHLLETYIF
ncbi:MAG: preprotein translocase subunit SecE [Candidatus Pacebacteria bacterium]|jgi:preprotein translocase subunit SecE|nr:preprotein translocase subunit SecE [Candidatus Paceibacterota bacterium]MDD2757061.1 preprotein translocase subunit SecE [Candidatus Paceibacterota bacterium]MDD3283880.1 preprotein translocase subunit SecE [Candidatus Paceibacterota bacterium]MDD3969844.1 preprotein translocase subunit SecE [Candidatus Paceibacterota bacterium]MDD4737744.1 preprotein translocase subunit SecE [Candidatus Paceibacterota bacterium]